MQPPISPGTVLRDRYIVKQVIGQGGMGRTYTAQDTERFNEICVLKEFIPATQSPEIIIKAKELFQREANTLYQIRHPQVPEFRATFEADSRLFLVQDYVEGKNYRTLITSDVGRAIILPKQRLLPYFSKSYPFSVTCTAATLFIEMCRLKT